MRIVLFGSNGRLGAAVARRLEADGHDLLRLRRADIDLADQSAVRSALLPLDFDLLYNSAALTDVDGCERDPDLADRTNALAPAAMAEVAAEKGARIVHVSTDYVYAGTDSAPRTEVDATAPESVYGQSKLRGDEAVLATCPDALVVRTSWVFGPDRPSFLDMILDRALEQDAVAAIADKTSTPSYSLDFAENLVIALASPDATGILNLCNAGVCTWQEFGQAGYEAAKRAGVAFRAPEIGALELDQASFFLAPRPRHTAMSTQRFAEMTGVTPRPWEQAVEDYIRDHYAPGKLSSGSG